MAWPFERPANRVAISGDEHANGAGARPRKEEELVLRNNSYQGLDGHCRICRLRNGKQRDHGGLHQIDHVVVLLISETQVLSCASSEEAP